MGLNKKLVKIIFDTAILFTLTCPFLLYAQNIDKNTVRDVQLMLALKDIHKGAIDGINGPVTRKSIEEYQRKHKAVVTGEISGLLRDKLRKELFLELELKTSEGEQIKQRINTHEEIKRLAEEWRKTKGDLQNTNVAIQELRDKKPQDSEGSKDMSDWLALIGQGSTFAIGILSIVLALMSLAGYAVYRLIRYKLDSDIKTLLQAAEAKIRYCVYANLSHAFYLYYRGFFEHRDHPAFRSGVELAIWFSEGAVDATDKMPDEQEKQDMKEFAESHRAYHYASQEAPSPLNRQFAINLVPQIDGLADRFYRDDKNKKWIDCKETIAWILIRLGDENQQAQGKRVLEELLEHLKWEDTSSLREEFMENHRRWEKNNWAIHLTQAYLYRLWVRDR